MNYIKNNKKLFMLILIAFLVISMGVSYAFFSSDILGSGNEITISASKIRLIFNGGSEININNITPGQTIASKTFTIENESNNTVNYNIVFSKYINTFLTTGYLQYKLESTNDGYSFDWKNVPKSEKKIDKTIAIDVAIDPDVIQEYTLSFRYLDSEDDQSLDMNKKLEGTIRIVESTGPRVTANNITQLFSADSGYYDGNYTQDDCNNMKNLCKFGNNYYGGFSEYYCSMYEGTYLTNVTVTFDNNKCKYNNNEVNIYINDSNDILSRTLTDERELDKIHDVCIKPGYVSYFYNLNEVGCTFENYDYISVAGEVSYDGYYCEINGERIYNTYNFGSSKCGNISNLCYSSKSSYKNYVYIEGESNCDSINNEYVNVDSIYSLIGTKEEISSLMVYEENPEDYGLEQSDDTMILYLDLNSDIDEANFSVNVSDMANDNELVLLSKYYDDYNWSYGTLETVTNGKINFIDSSGVYMIKKISLGITAVSNDKIIDASTDEVLPPGEYYHINKLCYTGGKYYANYEGSCDYNYSKYIDNITPIFKNGYCTYNDSNIGLDYYYSYITDRETCNNVNYVCRRGENGYFDYYYGDSYDADNCEFNNDIEITGTDLLNVLSNMKTKNIEQNDAYIKGVYGTIDNFEILSQLTQSYTGNYAFVDIKLINEGKYTTIDLLLNTLPNVNGIYAFVEYVDIDNNKVISAQTSDYDYDRVTITTKKSGLYYIYYVPG